MPIGRDMFNTAGSQRSAITPTGTLKLAHLLSPEADVHSRVRRALGEKRIVSLGDMRIVLSRHIIPGVAFRTSRRHQRLQGAVPVQKEIPLRNNFTWWPFGWWRAMAFEAGSLWHDSRPTPRHVRALAAGLSALHALVPEGKFPDIGSGLHPRKVSRLARRAVERSLALQPAEREVLLEFITQRAASLDPPEGLRLVHGDLHARNLIIQSNARTCLIDSEGVTSGLPLLEFAHVLINLFEEPRAGLRRHFIHHYMAAQTDVVRQHWRQFDPSLLIFARLMMAWRRYRRACTLAKRGAHREARFAARFHERFLRQAYQQTTRILASEAGATLCSSAVNGDSGHP